MKSHFKAHYKHYVLNSDKVKFYGLLYFKINYTQASVEDTIFLKLFSPRIINSYHFKTKITLNICTRTRPKIS